MAKKKRKTRKEKEMSKTHTFSQNTKAALTSGKPRDEMVGEVKGEDIPRNKQNNVPSFIVKDLKKVMVITCLIVTIVVVFWILANYTTLLDPLFHRVNVKY